jgi:hypothetical protein
MTRTPPGSMGTGNAPSVERVAAVLGTISRNLGAESFAGRRLIRFGAPAILARARWRQSVV